MIGAAYTKKPAAEPRGLPFVIGAAANGRTVTRELPAARVAVGGARTEARRPSSRTKPIVIGLRHDRR